MEIRTTFKQSKIRFIANKLDYKTKHFQDFSIITTAYDCNDDYAVTAIKDYGNESKQKSPTPPHRQHFIPFMINKYHDNMKKLMRRAGCSLREIKRAYDNYYEGIPGQQPRQVQQPVQKKKTKRGNRRRRITITINIFDRSDASTRASYKGPGKATSGKACIDDLP
eukprot:3347308-Amphidinium_carterae.1